VAAGVTAWARAGAEGGATRAVAEQAGAAAVEVRGDLGSNSSALPVGVASVLPLGKVPAGLDTGASGIASAETGAAAAEAPSAGAVGALAVAPVAGGGATDPAREGEFGSEAALGSGSGCVGS